MTTLDIGSLTPIYLGTTYSQRLKIASDWQSIADTDAGNPITVTLNSRQPNGLHPTPYTVGTKVVIGGSDNPVANGAWIVANPTANSFQITGAVGGTPGGSIGAVATAIDATGCTVIAMLLPNAPIAGQLPQLGTAPLFFFSNQAIPASPVLSRFTYTGAAPTGVFTWNDITSFDFTFSLTPAQTASIPVDALMGFIYFIDASGNITKELTFTVAVNE